jgi:Holliday junction DNA helicase RuvA
MIAQLRGKLASKSPNQVVVDVGGVGYAVFVPLSTYYQLPDPDGEVTLYTSTQVREDAILLYGFKTLEEKALFELLKGVSGIGPRLATNILSGISVEELVPALSEGDVARLRAVPGIGRKMAERLIVELREKVGEAPARIGLPSVPSKDEVLEDVISALMNLGCGRKEASRAAEGARRALGGDAGFEKLIKFALKAVSTLK